MSPWNVKTPPGWGGVKGEAGEASNLESKNSTRTGILAEHFCYCRPGFVCDLCLEWRRLICRLEAPRILSLAQSFRRQAICQIGGA